MGEAISRLLADDQAVVVRARTVVIYSPTGRTRKRFPENCVTEHASEAAALAAANPGAGYYAAIASGPSRSSEGFRLYYLVHWLE